MATVSLGFSEAAAASLQDLDFFVNAQDLRHLLGQLGIVALEVLISS